MITETADNRRLRWSRRAALRRAGASLAARAGSWDDVAYRRTCSCGMASAEAVGVSYSHSLGVAYPSTGVVTCGSVWACPVCAAKIRRVRTMEVEKVATWHAGRGGTLAMVTLTLRHTRRDALAPMVAGLCAAWRRVQQGAQWKLVRDMLDGMTRALEVTHGFGADGSNGWHPHLHLLLLVRPGLDTAAVVDLVRGVLLAGWSDAVVGELGGSFAPLGSVGVDVRPIPASAAAYVAKISAEVTRADLKSGSRQPWALIDAGRMSLFGEYARAMKGRRAVQFSRGLRDAAGLDLPDDDESLMMLDLDEGVIVAYVERRYWNRLVRHELALGYLELIAIRCDRVRAAGQPEPYS